MSPAAPAQMMVIVCIATIIDDITNMQNNSRKLQDCSFVYNNHMQIDNWDIIGTHISIQIDTDRDCGLLFGSIRERLQDFESRYSRFIP